MILRTSHTPEWIRERRKAYPKSDPTIIEKVIYALTLVEDLVQTGLKFTFKGGTSLLLILPEPRRFSIDVDIVTTETRQGVERALVAICQNSIFTKWELDEPRSYKAGIPKAHYLLGFYSQLDQTERVILLDVLYEEHGYAKLVQIPIVNDWIQTDSEQKSVLVPSTDSLTGDKLTAFAPNTIGIKFIVEHPGGRVVEKQMEVMKQLFDLGMLFDRITNLRHFKLSFEQTTKNEIRYRSLLDISLKEVLKDVINTSLMIASQGKSFDPARNFKHISMGLMQLKPYIYHGPFRIDEAILASSKAAYLAAILISGYDREILRWSDGNDIQQYFVKSVVYQFLNKRKNISGGPLFYWYHTLNLLGKL